MKLTMKKTLSLAVACLALAALFLTSHLAEAQRTYLSCAPAVTPMCCETTDWALPGCQAQCEAFPISLAPVNQPETTTVIASTCAGEVVGAVTHGYADLGGNPALGVPGCTYGSNYGGGNCTIQCPVAQGAQAEVWFNFDFVHGYWTSQLTNLNNGCYTVFKVSFP